MRVKNISIIRKTYVISFVIGEDVSLIRKRSDIVYKRNERIVN